MTHVLWVLLGVEHDGDIHFIIRVRGWLKKDQFQKCMRHGPHVCYRFWKYGKQVDHLREDFPSAEPIQEKFRSDFQEVMKKMKKEIETIPFDDEQHS